MIKKEIEYEDYNGDKVKDVFYFNLTKPEILELETEFEGGLARFLQGIIDARDEKNLIRQFKRIILLSYGEKSDDGRHFYKSDEIRERFVQSAAYAELFMKLATDDKFAVEFLNGVLPKDMVEEIQKAQALEGTGPTS